MNGKLTVTEMVCGAGGSFSGLVKVSGMAVRHVAAGGTDDSLNVSYSRTRPKFSSSTSRCAQVDPCGR